MIIKLTSQCQLFYTRSKPSWQVHEQCFRGDYSFKALEKHFFPFLIFPIFIAYDVILCKMLFESVDIMLGLSLNWMTEISGMRWFLPCHSDSERLAVCYISSSVSSVWLGLCTTVKTLFIYNNNNNINKKITDFFASFFKCLYCLSLCSSETHLVSCSILCASWHLGCLLLLFLVLLVPMWISVVGISRCVNYITNFNYMTRHQFFHMTHTHTDVPVLNRSGLHWGYIIYCIQKYGTPSYYIV